MLWGAYWGTAQKWRHLHFGPSPALACKLPPQIHLRMSGRPIWDAGRLIGQESGVLVGIQARRLPHVGGFIMGRSAYHQALEQRRNR